MNNKGFMMAEVIVVSAVILVTLVSLYISYNKIFSLYNQRIDYYDVSTLYELANIRDNYLYPGNVSEKKVVDGKIIYYLSKDSIKNKTLNTSDLKPTFIDYLDYLSTSLDFDNIVVNDWNIQNLLVMESCNEKNICKYAYLEVVDEDAKKIVPESSSSSSNSSSSSSSPKPSSSSSSKPSSSSSSKPSSSSSSKPSSSSSPKPSSSSSLKPSSSSSSSSILGTVGLCGACSSNNACAVGTCSGTCYNASGGTYRCCVDGSGRQCN